MTRDELTTTEALRIVTSVVMQALGTSEADIAVELRVSSLSYDVIYAALYKIRDELNHVVDNIHIYFPE